MKIESIKFKNFRQYRDAKIIFSYMPEDRCITIVQGPNGGGKTKIMNAITWCLYGKELHLGDKYKGLPIINTITLKKLTPNQITDVIIEITMRIDNKEKMIFRRTLDCKKLPGKFEFEAIKTPKEKSKTEGKLEVFYQSGRNWELATQPKYRVQRLLPQAIQEYFYLIAKD